VSGAGRRARWRLGRTAELLPERRRSLTRIGVTAVVAGVVAVATMVAAVLAVGPAPARVGGTGRASGQASVPLSFARRAAGQAAPAQAAPAAPAQAAPAAPAQAAPAQAGQPPFPLTLTAADRRGCPAAATACVDLTMHFTWLQSGGQVTYGPVQMEPGQPGSGHPTPRGTFHVAWKAGPAFVSDIYHEAMPWATFFAAGGIAFHGGSLTRWSHGCVHLSLADARYYNVHLPVGAEVVVF
jgi:lipoprotein-anchoring transpeptidase ErfK/SrfK